MKFPVAVELFYDSQWNDVTEYAYTRAPIEVQRGRSDESKHVEASECTVTLRNVDGRFSPRNPRSPLYGKIGRNTPIRVLMDTDARFTGEVAKWPQAWNMPGTDVYTPIEAAGILRRLEQGTPPANSALFRYTVRRADVVAYWPCEEESGASSVYSPIDGVESFRPAGVEYGAGIGIPAGSAPGLIRVPPGATGTLGQVPTSATAIRWLCNELFRVDEPSAAGFHAAFVVHTSGPDVERWQIEFTDTQVRFRAYDFADAEVLVDTAAIASTWFGQWWKLTIALQQNGSDVLWSWAVRATDEDSTLIASGSGTETSATLGKVTGAGMGQGPAGGAIPERWFGHVTVLGQSGGSQPIYNPDVVLGWPGETAGNRISRVCAEDGITFASSGDLDDTAAMGPQPVDTLVGILRECATADGGILYEPRGALGLTYRTRVDLYNQAPALELDYTAEVFGMLPEPVDDDQGTRNDVTVKRPGAGQARAELQTGPLSTQAPPDGVGRYDTSIEINVAGDGFLPDQAAWRLALGTVDQARYPTLGLNLTAPAFTTDAPLTAAAAALELGDRLTVANLPPWLPPETISVLAQGFTELLGNNEWHIEINTTPEPPWQVAQYEAAAGGDYRYDTAGSTLAAAFHAGTDTSMSVTVSVKPLWTTAAGEMPFDIEAGGVRLRVTAISGASSPQTFTITQAPINGITKTIPAGTPVSLWTKARYAL